MHICFLDIDGTLVLTGGAGQTAFAQALAEEFGIPEIDTRVAFAGRSDRAIAMDLFRSHDVEPSPENWRRFCAGYLRRLEVTLASHNGYVLPGVGELLNAFAARGDVALGLLTGNVREGARRKLGHYGLWDWFPFGGFGDEHVERCDIAAAALAAAELHLNGQSVATTNSRSQNRRGLAHFAESSEQNVPGTIRPGMVPLSADGSGIGSKNGATANRQIIVIGDTPDDVSCGRSIKARCVAVCTGHTPAQALRDAEPDVFVETLEDIEPILAILGD